MRAGGRIMTIPNWVRGRAECNLRMTFEALSQIVERDVAEANKVFADHQFKCERSDKGIRPLMYVSEIGADEGVGVEFKISKTAIRINGAGVQFYVRPRWDVHECQMHINDEPRAHELWEISQRALSHLFFTE